VGKVNMKKILILIASILLFSNSCVIDFGCGFQIVNRSEDTIYVCFAKYNNIDSVKYGLGLRYQYESLLDETGKIIVYENDVILPDSIGYYGGRGRCKDIFHGNYDNKGYFFIIKLETIDSYTWEEIRKNKLYNNIIVTKEELKKSDWKYTYSP